MDEIDLCVGDNFLYRAIPIKFLEEAREMKREMVRHIISEFEAFVLKMAKTYNS